METGLNRLLRSVPFPCFGRQCGGTPGDEAKLQDPGKIPIPALEMGTGITLNGALNLVYVSGGFNTGNVYVVDGYTFKLTATNPGSGASVDSMNDDYWAGGLYGGNVYVYSGFTNKLVDTLNVGNPYCPGAVQFDANTKVMWVATQCGT